MAESCLWGDLHVGGFRRGRDHSGSEPLEGITPSRFPPDDTPERGGSTGNPGTPPRSASLPEPLQGVLTLGDVRRPK